MADRRRIAIIDPEKLHQDLLESYLTQLGCQACSVTDVPSALDLVASTDISAAVIDLGTAMIDALDAVRKLKAVDPDLRIILIMAHPTLEGLIKAVHCGVVDFMIKPFGLQDLKECLKRVAAVRREYVSPESIRLKISMLRNSLGERGDGLVTDRSASRGAVEDGAHRKATERNFSPGDSE